MTFRRFLIPFLAVCALMLGQLTFFSLARAAPPDPVMACITPASGDLALSAIDVDAMPDAAALTDPPSGLTLASSQAGCKGCNKLRVHGGGDGDDDEPETSRADPPDPPTLPA